MCGGCPAPPLGWPPRPDRDPAGIPLSQGLIRSPVGGVPARPAPGPLTAWTLRLFSDGRVFRIGARHRPRRGNNKGVRDSGSRACTGVARDPAPKGSGPRITSEDARPGSRRGPPGAVERTAPGGPFYRNGAIVKWRSLAAFTATGCAGALAYRGDWWGAGAVAAAVLLLAAAQVRAEFTATRTTLRALGDMAALAASYSARRTQRG